MKELFFLSLSIFTSLACGTCFGPKYSMLFPPTLLQLYHHCCRKAELYLRFMLSKQHVMSTYHMEVLSSFASSVN